MGTKWVALRHGLWLMLLAWHLGGGIGVCRGQGDRGGITGRAVDASQAVAAKARVAAKSLDTG